MDKQIIDGYRVSGSQKTHMKVSKFSISENESLSMLNRYRFYEDDELGKEVLYKNAEKNYQETKKINYLVTYRELLKYNSWELFRQLSDKLLPSYERKELLKNTIIMVMTIIVNLIIIDKVFDNLGISLVLRKIPNIIIGIIYIVVPLLIALLVATILKQVIANKKKKMIGFIKLVICAVGVIVSVLNINKIFNFINLEDVLKVETDRIDVVEASELYMPQSDSIEQNDVQMIEADEADVVLKLNYFDNFIDTVEETYKAIEYEDLEDLFYRNEDVVACDLSGKEYTLSQLSDQKLLIPYMDGEKAVLFYGQYNNYYWDGECIFNIYEYNEDIGENILKIILEAKYDNGSLVSYKKITKATTGQGVNVWSISDRIREKNYNRGETYYYLQSKDYLQDFDIDTAGVENIIYFDNFENILKENAKLEGYYYGNTSDGYYNDDTGNAYMVKYAEDGTIRTLYRGGFKNGFPDDQTGKAYQIVFDSSNNINKYFYYKGKFKNGNRMGRVTSDNYVEQEDIEQIIDGMTFNCLLNWYIATE